MSNDDANWTGHRDELFERVVHRGRARKRRRALSALGVVAMVGAVAAFGLYAPGRGHDALHVGGEGSTTTLPSRPGGVLLIGDSLMQLAEPALAQAIPQAHVDAAATRQFGGAVPILEAAKQRGELPPTIVIHLGDNGPSEGDVFDRVTTEFKTIMDVVGPGSEAYFLTLKLPRQWEAMVNSALYSEAGAFPNAHVLAWDDFSRSHGNWFLGDGFHLNSAGKAAYAAFIRDGIGAPAATFTDPFTGRAVPAGGFLVTDDPKAGAAQGPSSFAMELFDDAGNDLGTLPRATIEDAALNATRHVLVVTDTGIHLEAKPFDEGVGLPSGCLQTESDQELAVALCGSGSGENLLGKRIVVNHGKGWTQVIGLPPVQAGDPLVGHWAWASPSPDGRWVAGGWSAECEVPMGLFVSVADGSVHAVTGEAGTAWREAPESGTLGWAPDGSAMVVFGGSSECGASTPIQRGIYLVSPDTGSRRLLLPLTHSQGVLRWSSVDDRRTAPTPSTPMSPPGEGDATAGITYAYGHFFDPALALDQRAALIQGGTALRTFMQQSSAAHAAEAAAGAIVVDQIVVHGDAADVSFHALYQGRESPVNPGQLNGIAVLEDGTWKISRATYCTLTANDGEVCPPG